MALTRDFKETSTSPPHIIFCQGGAIMTSPSKAGQWATVILAALVLLVSPGVSFAGEGFDGKWLTTVSCEASRDALAACGVSLDS